MDKWKYILIIIFTGLMVSSASFAQDSAVNSGGAMSDNVAAAPEAGLTPDVSAPVGGFGTSTSTGRWVENARSGFGSRAAPIRASDFFICPMVMVGYGNNDNLYGNSVDKKSSGFMTVQPALDITIKSRGDRYGLTYSGNFTKYFSSSADDFNSHAIELSGDNVFTARHQIDWGVGYRQDSSSRGTFSTYGDGPDKWSGQTARFLYIMGSKESTGKLELEAGYFERKYDNANSQLAIYSFDSTMLDARFFYKIMPRTSLLLEWRNVNNDFLDSLSLYDSKANHYLAGVTWEATAATSGTVKVGRMEKNYSQLSVKPSGFSWEVGANWAPLSYSKVVLTSSRSFEDSNFGGDYADTNNTNLAWLHNWNSFMQTRAQFGKSRAEFKGSSRTDKTDMLSLGFSYDFKRWARIGLDYDHTNRKSNVSASSYKRNLFMLTVEFSL